jgi:hypothetical protein
MADLTFSARVPHGGRQLSVRNVVPTLTSNKRQGLSVNGRVGECVRGCCKYSCVDVLMSPTAGGVHLPFIGQGEGDLQVRRTVQLHGGAWCATP